MQTFVHSASDPRCVGPAVLIVPTSPVPLCAHLTTVDGESHEVVVKPVSTAQARTHLLGGISEYQIDMEIRRRMRWNQALLGIVPDRMPSPLMLGRELARDYLTDRELKVITSESDRITVGLPGSRHLLLAVGIGECFYASVIISDWLGLL